MDANHKRVACECGEISTGAALADVVLQTDYRRWPRERQYLPLLTLAFHIQVAADGQETTNANLSLGVIRLQSEGESMVRTAPLDEFRAKT